MSCSIHSPGDGGEVGEFAVTAFGRDISLHKPDDKRDQRLDVRNGHSAGDLDAIPPAPGVGINAFDSPRVRGPGSALGSVLDPANAPSNELAASLFDGVGKVGIQGRARAIGIVPEPRASHSRATRTGTPAQRAAVASAPTSRTRATICSLNSGVRVVGRPPSRRTPRPPLQSLCFSESSDTVPSLRCRYTTVSGAFGVAPPRLLRPGGRGFPQGAWRWRRRKRWTTPFRRF
jgi:hypothetical protein